MNKKDIVVSVYTLVYNHEPFLKEAIEGVVNQQCDYTIELMLGEDCSTDNSRAVISHYASLYPDIVKPIFNEKNIGYIANSIKLMKACRGKYVATMEGDDYWIDVHKIQKQVDFLEANPDYSACFCKVKYIDEQGNEMPQYHPAPKKDDLDFADIIAKHYIPTPGYIFRKNLPDPMPEFYLNDPISMDLPIEIIAAEQGKTKYMRDVMAVHRSHAGGITKNAEQIKKIEDGEFLLYEKAMLHYGKKYETIFYNKLREVARTNMIYGSSKFSGMERMAHVRKWTRRFLKYSPDINKKELLYYFLLINFPWLLKLKK